MQQGRYQYSKSQYPFVVYLFWYSVLANRTHVSFGNGNKWGGRILSSSAVNVILTAEKLVQTCWLDFGSKKKKKLSNAVTFLSDHNFHACHFFPG